MSRYTLTSHCAPDRELAIRGQNCRGGSGECFKGANFLASLLPIPDAEFPVGVAGQDVIPIGSDCSRGDRATATSPKAQVRDLSCLNITENRHGILGSREKEFCGIGIETQTPDLFACGNRVTLRPVLEAPEPTSGIISARDDMGAVRRKGHTDDLIEMTDRGQQFLAVFEIVNMGIGCPPRRRGESQAPAIAKRDEAVIGSPCRQSAGFSPLPNPRSQMGTRVSASPAVTPFFPSVVNATSADVPI